MAQVIEEKNENYFDSLLLSPDCKLNKSQLGGIFTHTEVLAGFPGGFQKWFEYATQKFDFHFIEQRISDSTQRFEDSLVVKFIVTRNGSICHIQVQKGNPLLVEPVIRLLKSSPNWTPATNSGRTLNAYRRLRIDVFIDRKEGVRTIKHFTNSYFRDYD